MTLMWQTLSRVPNPHNSLRNPSPKTQNEPNSLGTRISTFLMSVEDIKPKHCAMFFFFRRVWLITEFAWWVRSRRVNLTSSEPLLCHTSHQYNLCERSFPNKDTVTFVVVVDVVWLDVSKIYIEPINPNNGSLTMSRITITRPSGIKITIIFLS